MLRQIDRAFAAVTWVVAGLVVVMLLFGPAVVAHDQRASAVSSGSSPYTGGSTSGAGAATTTSGGSSAANGKQLFISSCGSCHTFHPARTTGQIGPDLDQSGLSASRVAAQISSGGGGMPAFSGQLSAAQIQAIAAFVAGTH